MAKIVKSGSPSKSISKREVLIWVKWCAITFLAPAFVIFLQQILGGTDFKAAVAATGSWIGYRLIKFLDVYLKDTTI